MASKIETGNLTRKGMGRPKGVPNKTTKAAKDMIAEVAEGLGGAKRMLAWAKEAPENEKAFWTSVYPKLIPLTVGSDPDNPLAPAIIQPTEPKLTIAPPPASIMPGATAWMAKKAWRRLTATRASNSCGVTVRQSWRVSLAALLSSASVGPWRDSSSRIADR